MTLKKTGHSIQGLFEFLDNSPTPWHAVDCCRKLLNARGFQELHEDEHWQLKTGGYFICRNGSSLVAFQYDEKKQASFKIIGAHTDSPNLRLKTGAQFQREGYEMLGVETYGGVLLSTWLDRDLALAGRVVTKGDNGLVSRLVNVNQPLCRVPNLAIHLNPEVNKKGLVLNRQKEMVPVAGLEGADLMQLLAEQLNVAAGKILNYELCLFDATPASLGGMKQEFIYSARLDNLAMCHAGLTALLNTQNAPTIPMVALFDHEEIGSRSAAGAASGFLGSVIERICEQKGASRQDYHRAIASSILLSADMAHAVHPNYGQKHDENYKPRLNQGPVIKINQNQSYATNALTESYFEDHCSLAGVNVQKFVNRADLGCGSTIGPITASQLGIATVDVGNAMLSMHSAREMAGAADHDEMIKVFKSILHDKPVSFST